MTSAHARTGVRVRVELMGSFDLDFGTDAFDVSLEAPATVETLLRRLARLSPAGQRLWRLLAADGSSRRSYVVITVDYVLLDPHTALATPLHDDARVCIATPMVGG